MGLLMKLVVAVALLAISMVGVARAGLTEQCSTSIQQLSMCLAYATGKAPTPTKQCCTSVADMKNKEPVCLCYFIGQAHNGSDAVKSLGIQEATLLRLPSACQLDANVSNCPKLLGISPSSPAAAIFMHTNATSPTASTTPSSSSSSSSDDKSSGFKHKIGLLGGVVAIFTSLFL